MYLFLSFLSFDYKKVITEFESHFEMSLESCSEAQSCKSLWHRSGASGPRLTLGLMLRDGDGGCVRVICTDLYRVNVSVQHTPQLCMAPACNHGSVNLCCCGSFQAEDTGAFRRTKSGHQGNSVRSLWL